MKVKCLTKKQCLFSFPGLQVQKSENINAAFCKLNFLSQNATSLEFYVYSWTNDALLILGKIMAKTLILFVFYEVAVNE